MAAWASLGERGCWEYDSTWESEEEEEEESPVPGGPRGSHQAGGAQERRRPAVSPMCYRGCEFSMGRNWTAAKDMQRYRHRYPGLKEREDDEEEEEMWNLSFYKNEINFLPRGLHIDELLEAWQEDYETLEENHSYIQWLFPLRERGMNWRAKPLTCKEIQAFKKSKEVMQRFIRAYKLMLGFYGINLINEETGEVKRAENWVQRFRNLDRFSHNNLRITRILKCLGEMGYEHYQVHLVKFFLTETLVNQMLPNVKRSALDYFLFTIRNKHKRRELIHYAWKHFNPQNRFVWGPHRKLLAYKPPLSMNQHCRKTDEEQGCIEDKETVGIDEASLLSREETVGDAAHSQTHKVTGKCILEEQSKQNAMKPGDRIPSEELVGRGDGSEIDCPKESKKRKFKLNCSSVTCPGLLKSPTDIEKISYNLGECAIDRETPETLPALLEKEDPIVLEEGDKSSEDFKVCESSDAPLKRRKVDEAALENSTVNEDIGTGPFSLQAVKPKARGCEAENGEVSEEDVVAEEINVLTGNGAESMSVNSLGAPETNEPGLLSLMGSDSALHEANAEHQCDDNLPGSESLADNREQKEEAEGITARGKAKSPTQDPEPREFSEECGSILS